MSVTCVLHEAADAEIEALLAEPERIHRFLNPPKPRKPYLISRLFGSSPDLQPPIAPSCYIGKSWHAIHFVLAGSTAERPLPEGFLFSGGDDIGDEEVGFGPARALGSRHVREISSYLGAIAEDAFRDRVDPLVMADQDVYGRPFPGDTEALRFFVADFSRLRNFVSSCARAGDGVVIQYL